MNVIISKVKGAEAITCFSNIMYCSDYAFNAKIIIYYNYNNYNFIILFHAYSFCIYICITYYVKLNVWVICM